jgi:oligopeptidase B
MKPPPIPPAVLRGDNCSDPYQWLRDKNNPAAIEYLNAENRYTESIMQPTEALREKLYREILGRVKETDLSVPTYHGGYFYYTRTEKGKQYAIYCRKQASAADSSPPDAPDAPEQVLLDANELATGQKYFRIGVFQPSPDHRSLAYSTDVEGDEVYTVRIKDLRTGQLLPDTVPGTGAALEWANDNRTFFYTTLDPAKRPYKVYRYQLGGGNSQAVEVYHEPDERFNVDLAKSKSEAYLFLDIGSHVTSECRYLSAAEAEGVFRVLLPRRQDVEYSVAHHGAHFYIRINDTGKNFRLVKTPVEEPLGAEPSAANFVEVRAHRDGVFIEAVDAFRNHLVLVERDRGLRGVAIEHLATGAQHRIAFDEPVYTAGLGANPEFDTNLLRFTYTSLVTPASVFDYDMDRRTRELKKQTEVLGGYDPAQYVSERVFATAPDGVPVPVSLVYKSGLVRDGQAPALLYGYGAYGHSSDPAFASDRLSLLDRGFVYAIAHIRGGSEMGRPWYEDGKLLRKKNSFTDFVACAEYLIGQGYTSSGRLAILGGSAGGLLIGAVLNLRPDLFHAAVAKVPFVDVLNTMLDASLPLTITEYEEWGNPNSPQFHEYIRSYSPYDNVERKAYPNLLITAGLNDPRVSYWEPAKWAARLRAAKSGDRLLLLKTNMGAGHFGASGRYERFQETAFDYAFVLKTLGIDE